MKIAMIGPGYCEIPPKDHGAVEIVIYELATAMRERGHQVDIYNTQDLRSVAESINAGDYDFVHLQYENYAAFFNEALDKKIPFAVTGHYGWIMQPGQWDHGYKSIFEAILNVSYRIALSDQINYFYIANKAKAKTYTLPNGVNVNRFAYSEIGNGRAICLGKIEPRKNQVVLNENLKGIDFVGPLAEPFVPNTNNRYLGTWTKDEVYNRLTTYSCLILLSNGEAAPLVVLEAMAAGLSIIVSNAAAANLPIAMPIINCCTSMDQKLLDYVIANNTAKARSYLRGLSYCFHWKEIAAKYEFIIKDILNDSKNRICNNSN